MPIFLQGDIRHAQCQHLLKGIEARRVSRIALRSKAGEAMARLVYIIALVLFIYQSVSQGTFSAIELERPVTRELSHAYETAPPWYGWHHYLRTIDNFLNSNSGLAWRGAVNGEKSFSHQAAQLLLSAELSQIANRRDLDLGDFDVHVQNIP